MNKNEKTENIKIFIDKKSEVLYSLKNILNKISSLEIVELANSEKEDKQNYKNHKADIIITNKSNSIKITAREKEILILICKEYTTKKIAKKLSISTSTIETHRKKLLTKLKVKSQSGLVREAIRYGFYVFN